MVGMPQAI